MDDFIEMMVEIPKGSRNKYEYDHERRAMRLDHRLYSAVTFPADYGFVAGTEGADGEPLDALVLLEDPTFPGCLVRARPVGVFWMADEKGPDAKIICVPVDDPRSSSGRVSDLADLPRHLLDEIEHFFDVYKMLEPGTSPAPDGYEGREAALREVEAARNRAGHSTSE